MKIKKILLIAIPIFLLLLLILIPYGYKLKRWIKGNSPYVEASLVINGTPVDNLTVLVNRGYGRLPLMTTLEELGFEVVWENERIATVKIAETVYRVDFDEKTFCNSDPNQKQSHNLQISLPGERFGYLKVVDGDLWIDDHHFNIIMEFTDGGFHADDDYKSRTISISPTEGTTEGGT